MNISITNSCSHFGVKRLVLVSLCALFCCDLSAQTAPKLLPFQGRLTDQNGGMVSNGVRLAQFKIFDVPTGGSPVWAGELHRTTVNGGLVNVLLGSKTPLNFDFDRQLYLEITVDVSGPTGQPDNAITLADPPMLPRQVIPPVLFAKEAADSRKLNGFDWTPIFGANNPNLPIPASKLADASLPGGKIQPNTITSNQIASQTIGAAQIVPGTITSNQISSGTITSNQIANGSIDVSDLAQQVAEALNPPGTIVAFGGETTPPGWLLCDGSLQPIATYPRLSQAIGVRWGTNSATQFRLPDLRGVFLRGVTGSRSDGFQDPGDGRIGLFGSASTLGVGSFQQDVFKSHTHQISVAAPQQDFGSEGSGTPVGALGEGANPYALTNVRGGNETRPKNAYVNYLIKY